MQPALQIVCTSCSAKLKVKEELIGKAIKCPKCGKRIAGSANGSMAAKVARPDDPLGTTDHRPSTATPAAEVTTDGAPGSSVVDGGTGAFLPGQNTPPNETPPASGLPTIPGYRVLREIARGGMGKVLAAHDLNLDREVALKILLPGARADRFVRESKITARLPHPGIPPIYDLGTLADGSPFLAMKLIAGQTLAEEMTTADRPRLLQVFTQVCQAVGFAHSRGIIHRDMKPANIMVGAFGEVQVMDWGLAKDLGGREVEASDPSAVPTVPAEGIDGNQTTDHREAGESTDDRTQAGQVMGTPAYMAPEQARGEAVDARADVFSLGGILCAILTGKPPFGGKSALEVIKQAAGGNLAKANARLDACDADEELVALCRHCLSANPMDRPANGQAVADGLTAYLHGVQERLQAAERERAVAVAREAEQRKRRRVVQWAGGGIAAVLLLGICGTTLGMFWANTAAAKERTANAAAQSARTEAENAAKAEEAAKIDALNAAANEKTAREAEATQRTAAEKARDRTRDVLDAMVSEVTGDSLTTQMEISAEQKKFLESVLGYYREFAGENPDDERSRARHAQAAYRVGLIEVRLGRKEQSAAAFRLARDGYASLAADFPAVPDYRKSLARDHTNLGNVLGDLGQGAAAEEQYRKGLAIQEKLAADFPAVPDDRKSLAMSHGNLGNVLGNLGQGAAAEEQYRKALAIQEKLAADFPAVPAYRQNLATRACLTLGFFVQSR